MLTAYQADKPNSKMRLFILGVFFAQIPPILLQTDIKTSASQPRKMTNVLIFEMKNFRH